MSKTLTSIIRTKTNVNIPLYHQKKTCAAQRKSFIFRCAYSISVDTHLVATTTTK